MTNEEFPSNSKNVIGETAKPKVDKVVTGEVVKRPKSLGRKFKDVFIGGEFKSAARYIAADVLLPALRNLVVDTTTKGIERIIYGESAAARRRTPEYRPRTQYSSPIWRGDPRDRDRAYLPKQPPYIPRGSRHQVGEVIVSTREEAEMVVEALTEIISKYDVASVGDLNDLLGLATTYVDNNWGWTFLNSVVIRQIREGYLIDLPPAEPLR